jgi:hypothetical protein
MTIANPIRDTVAALTHPIGESGLAADPPRAPWEIVKYCVA